MLTVPTHSFSLNKTLISSVVRGIAALLLIPLASTSSLAAAPDSSLSCKDWRSYKQSLANPAQHQEDETQPGAINDEASSLPAQFDQLIVSKKERKLIAFSNNQPIKQYAISIGQSPLGAKTQDGDYKTPEGQYFIQRKNPRSRYYLALQISYPAKKDLELAKKRGVLPGDSIMLHGFPLEPTERTFATVRHSTSQDWTQGCVAVNDEEIAEIYSRVEVQTPILICP